tara:strand:- start:3033 stop:3296 length:264 start_codon:yes stop_codon:yes gene_type:complete
MIGIIKILAIVYLTLSVIYFMVTGKQNLIYGVKYSTTIWAKIYSAFWIIGFSLLMGGFLVMKDCVKVGKRVVSIYKAYRQIKKLNKK